MKVVVAPNAFKDCMTAAQAAAAMARGIRNVAAEVELVQVPVADGGDGLAEVLLEALHGEAREVEVSGPLRDPIVASFCHVPTMDLAAVEMASASGLALLRPEQRDPVSTTTYGTGQLISAALDLGAGRIVVGIGGSATNDGGVGMATALGMRFLDRAGREVAPTGGGLADIDRIDAGGLDARVSGVRFEAICDVDNPLLGQTGAAHVYGPQKGADPKVVKMLDAGLANLADVIERDLGLDVRTLPGAGAAGGLGAGLCAFLGAELRRGVDLVLDLVALDEKLSGADLVLTAEGQIDFQTAFGKAPAGVGLRARKQGIPCIAIAGSIGECLGDLHSIGVDAVFSLCPGPVTLEQAMADGEVCLARACEQVLRCFLAGRNNR